MKGARTCVVGVLAFLAFAVPAYAAAPGPDTVIDTMPPASTNQTSATFTFHAVSAPTATFECRVDAGTFSSCTSGYTTGSLSEGTHTFHVRASAGGSAPGTPASYSWTVDLTPPTTVITSQPPALTNSRTATFTFSSPDTTATFLCSLNGSPSAPCTSPVIYTGLLDGTRSLLIQAVDPAGNVDPTAKPIIWTVDTTPPHTAIVAPKNIIGLSDPQFTFTSSEPGSTFECSVGKAPFTVCSSPLTVNVPHSGSHELRVRATDAAGNVEPTPAVYIWDNDLTPPKRPSVVIVGDAGASASAVEAAVIPSPGLTSTPAQPPILGNPIHTLPKQTSPFTLDSSVRAQWLDTDPSAVSYDVTAEVAQAGSGTGAHVLTTLTKITKKALVLKPGTGNTVCVTVAARDAVGNVSSPATSCITIPYSFAPPWSPGYLGRVKDKSAWHDYYVVLAYSSEGFFQPINAPPIAVMSKVAVVAERCKGCGKIGIGLYRGYGKLDHLLTISLVGSGKSGPFKLFTRSLSTHAQRKFGRGEVVLYRMSGTVHVSGVGFLGASP